MKKKEIKIGQTYAVMIGRNVVPVRLTEEHPDGGWLGTTAKGAEIRIKSPQRLREVWRDRPVSPKSAPVAKRKAKPTTATKSGKKAKGAKRGCLTVAVAILSAAKEPMTSGEIMAKMLENGLWRTKGKTPAATLYAAMIREIVKKKSQSRFRKTGRGKFALKI